MKAAILLFFFSVTCAFIYAMPRLPIDSLKRDSFARSLDTLEPYRPQRQIKLRTGYGSDFAYRGLNEPKTPYSYTTASYFAKSGFFASAYMYNLLKPDSNRSLAEVDCMAGWDFFFGDNADAGVSLTKSFYDRKNFVLQTALSNTGEAYYGYDFNLIYVSLRGTYSQDKFQTTATHIVPGKKKGTNVIVTSDTIFNVHDYYLTLQLSHDFIWFNAFRKNDELIIGPTYYIIGGTDNFTSALLKHSFPQYQVINDNTNKFHLLYYTLSLPVLYYIGNFFINPAYEYNIARVLPAGVSNGNYSLFKLAIGYRFKFKDKKQQQATN